MLDFLKKLTGADEGPSVAELMQQGAQIVDVRSPEEFAGGHVAGAVNIPLQNLDRGLAKIRKDRPVITCCASGMRSAAAKRQLEMKGYSPVVNGGGWTSLQRKLTA